MIATTKMFSVWCSDLMGWCGKAPHGMLDLYDRPRVEMSWSDELCAKRACRSLQNEFPKRCFRVKEYWL